MSLFSSEDEDGGQAAGAASLSDLQQLQRQRRGRGTVAATSSSKPLASSSSSNAKSKLSALISREKLVRTKGAGADAAASPPSSPHRVDANILKHSKYYRGILRNARSRSLSPSPSKRAAVAGAGSEKDQDHPRRTATATAADSSAPHEARYDYDLMRRLDGTAFRDISQRLTCHADKIAACPDVPSLQRSFLTAQSDLACYGLAQVQLWFLSPQTGTLNATSVDTNTHVSMSATHMAQLSQLAWRARQGEAATLYRESYRLADSVLESDRMGVAGSVATVRPDDPLWFELEQCMRLMAAEGKEEHDLGLGRMPVSRRWYAIHIISPRNVTNATMSAQSASSGSSPGHPYLLLAESLSSPSSIVVSSRSTLSSPAQVKSLFVLECLQKLYSSIMLRLAQFQQQKNLKALQQQKAVAEANIAAVERRELCLKQMQSSKTYGQLGVHLARAAHALAAIGKGLDSTGKHGEEDEHGNTASGVYAWVVLPQALSSTEHLEPCVLGSSSILRVISGHNSGELTHSKTLPLPADRNDNSTLGWLLRGESPPGAVQVIPQVPAGALLHAGLAVGLCDGNAVDGEEEGDARNTVHDEWRHQGYVRNFTVQAVSLPLFVNNSNSSRCLVILASATADIDVCATTLRSSKDLGLAGLQEMTARSCASLQQSVRHLPGALLLDLPQESQLSAGQPVPTQLIGAVQAMSNALEGETSLASLGAYTAKLLFSDKYAASLQLLQSPVVEGYLSFSRVNSCGELQSVQPHDQMYELGTLLWVQQLRDGNTVPFQRDATTRSDAPSLTSFEIEQARESESMAERQRRRTTEALQDFVLGIEPKAETAILVPIQATAGMCVLLLVHTVLSPGAEEGTQVVHAATHLPSSDVLAAYDAGELQVRMAKGLNMAHAMHLGQLAAMERGKEEQRTKAARLILEKQSNRQRRMWAFLQWKEGIARIEAEIARRQLQAAVKIFAPPHNYSIDDSDEKSEFHSESAAESFMLRLEVHVKEIFPYDAIDVTIGGVAPSAIAVSQLQPSDCVQVEMLEIGNNVKAVLYGLVRDGSRLCGTIRVVRTAPGSSGPFPSSLVSQLGQLCHVASLSQAALRHGLAPPKSKGNVAGLLLPILMKVLPILLQQPEQPQSQQSLRAILEILASSLKYLCGGDVAILRMPYGMLGGDTNAFDEGAKGVCNVSSEDKDFSLSALLNAVPELTSGTRDESVPFDGQGNAALAEASFAQLLFKITTGSSSSDEEADAKEIAEVKVLGPQDGAGFTADQAAAARLVTFAISHVVSVARRQRSLGSTAQTAHRLAMELRGVLQTASTDLRTEQAAALLLRTRLSSSLGLGMFVAQASDLTAFADLVAFSNEALPSVFGCSRIALMVHTSLLAQAGIEGHSDPESREEGLRLVLPGSTTTSSETMSYEQLREIPTFEATGAAGAGQEKMLFTQKGAAHPFAAVLILHASPTTNGSQLRVLETPPASTEPVMQRPWLGIVDVLQASLSGCLSTVLDRIISVNNMRATRLQLDSEAGDAETARSEIAVLTENLNQETVLKSDYATQAENLREESAARQAQIDRLKEEIKQLALADDNAMQTVISERDTQYSTYISQTRTIEKDGQRVKQLYNAAESHVVQLTQLCDSFAFDERCHTKSVSQWLSEFVESRGYILLRVEQAADGSLSGAHEVHGVISAAGESLRMQNYVEISSTYVPQAPASEPVRATATDSGDNDAANALHRRQMWLSVRQNGDRAAVLCLPNKCISLHAAHDNAVYVIVKGSKDPSDAFEPYERTLLQCAVGLCCRALHRASSRYSFEEMRHMELELQQERACIAKIRHGVLAAEMLQRRPCTTHAEFAHEVEVGVAGLLTRGDSDPCDVDCFFWYIPAEFAATSVELPVIYTALHSTRHTRGDAEAIKKCLSTEQSLRTAGTMWVPLRGSDAKLIALLRCERKLSGNVDALSLAPLSGGRGPQVADLVLTPEEEEAVCVFCRSAVSNYHRIESMADAESSINQAGQAIRLLEERKAYIEEQVQAVTIVRTQYQNTLIAGADILAASCAKRATVEQILEATRRTLVTLTGAADCYLMLPRVEGMYPIGAVEGEEDLATEPELFCLESGRPHTVRVNMEERDLEAAALHAFRPLSVGGQPSQLPEEERFSDGHISSSWAVRRAHASGLDALSSVSSLYATALPFALITGQRAIVTVMKRGEAFTVSDKECAAWVLRTMSYCLDMWIGKGSLNLARIQVEELTEKLQSMRTFERLELDTIAFQNTLSSANAATFSHHSFEKSADGSEDTAVLASDEIRVSSADLNTPKEAVETLVQTVRTVFVGGDITVLTDVEAGNEVGTLLPTEEDVKSQAAGVVGVAGHNEGKSSEESDDFSKLEKEVSGPTRGSVRTATSRASYWIGETSGTSTGSMSSVKVIALVVHASFPQTWVQITNIDSTGVGSQKQRTTAAHLSLRMTVLLRLLEAQAMWRGPLVQAHEDMARLRELAKGLMAENTSEREKHRIQMHVAVNKRKKDQNALLSLCMATQTLSRASYFRGRKQQHFLSDTTKRTNKRNVWMNRELTHYCETVAAATGWNTSLGHLKTHVLDTYTVEDSAEGVNANAGFTLDLPDGTKWSFSAAEAKALALQSRTDRHCVVMIGAAGGKDAYAKNAKNIKASSIDDDDSDNIDSKESDDKHFNIQAAFDGAQGLVSVARNTQWTGPTLDVYNTSEKDKNEELDSEDEFEESKQADDELPPDYPKVWMKIVPEFTSLFPEGTILIPLVNVSSVLVLHVPKTKWLQSEAGEVADASVALAIASEVMSGLVNSEWYSKCGNEEALCEQELDSNAKALSELTQKHALLSMQRNNLQESLKRNEISTVLLRDTRLQNRRYERGLADWAEMIRGVNRSAQNLDRGVISFWMQASKCIMSIVSSHVGLRGCGLCISSDAYKHYAVRNDGIRADMEGGVEYFAKGYDGSEPGQGAEYDPAFDTNMAPRGLSDLGPAVEKHIISILTGEHNDGGRAIYRLSRPISAEDEEQIWLVPIRTASEVLAVLRVSVTVRQADFAPTLAAAQAIDAEGEARPVHDPLPPQPLPSTPQQPREEPGQEGAGSPYRTKIRFTPDTRMTPTRTDIITPRSVGSVASQLTVNTEATGLTAALNSTDEAVDSAQTNVLNFAEVLAPMLAAERTLESMKRENAGLQNTTTNAELSERKMHAQVLTAEGMRRALTLLLQEMSEFAGRIRLDHSTAEALAAANKQAARSGTEEDISNVLSVRMLPMQVLADKLGKILGGTVNMVLEDAPHLGIHNTDSAFGQQSGGQGSGKMVIQALQDSAGNALGKVNVALGTEVPSLLVEDRDAANTSLTAESEHHKLIHKQNVHEEIVQAIMPALSRALGGLLETFGRERLQIKHGHDLTDQRDDALEHMEMQKQTVQRTEEESKRHLAQSKYYSVLWSLGQQCFSYIDSLDSASDSAMDAEGNRTASLAHMLPSVCATLPSMTGCDCHVTVAVADDASMGADNDISAASLTWHEAVSATETGMTHQQVDRVLSNNLAHACLISGVTSTIEVAGNAGEGSPRLRVTSYPLLVTGHRKSLGVLQTIVSTSSAKEEISRNDDLCAAAARALACAVLADARMTTLNARVRLSDHDLTAASSKVEELSTYTEMWQRRADAWNGVAAAAAVVVRHGAAGDMELAELLASDAVLAPLRGTGVSIKMLGTAASESEKSASGRRQGRADIVRLGNGANDPTVEVVCDTGDDSGIGNTAYLSEEGSLVPIASELVNALGTVVRSIALANRSHANTLGSLNSGNETLRARVKTLEGDLNTAVEHLMETRASSDQQLHAAISKSKQLQEVADLAASSMTSFCGPTIREISGMLEDIGQDRRPKISLGKNGSMGQGSTMDWAWDGIARIADRAMNRVSAGSFGYHASILVQSDKPQGSNGVYLSSDIHVKVFDMARSMHLVAITGNNRGPKQTRRGIMEDTNASTVERALFAGGTHENKNSLSHVDLSGIEKTAMETMMTTTGAAGRVTVLCVSLPDAPPGVSAVLRLVYPTEKEPTAKDEDGGSDESPLDIQKRSMSSPRALVRPVMEMIMALGCSVLHICAHLSGQDAQVTKAEKALKDAVREQEQVEAQLTNTLRMHKVVCREACILLDPPLVGPGGSVPRAVHPASLTPLAASQDTCMKILSITRTLVRGEGQALLLRDPTTEKATFQVIFGGNGMSFTGVEQGAFGTITNSSSAGLSLAETAMQTHKIVCVDDASDDPRYNATLDGNVGSSVPLAAIPIRGRGSAVIGALLCVRGRNGNPFSNEDLIAAEVAASHGGLSIYWCQGLGSVHHILSKNVNRLQELERAFVQLSK